MTRYRLPALAFLVTALLAVVALAARSRPLGTGGSTGHPSSQFFDYGFTSVVIVWAVLLGATIWGFARKAAPGQKPVARSSLLAALLFWAAAGLIWIELTSHHFLRRFHHLEEQLHLAQRKGTPLPTVGGAARGAHGHVTQLRWDEIAIVLAVLGALALAAVIAGRRRRPDRRAWRFGSHAAVSAALDDSLEDLRSEPDLRKAIIAAYARMERALAAAGLARRPAEAPLEYVERALGELDTSAGAIRRLTELFEWAKFSQHEPEPSMRDEAIDALVAVRDELRAPEAEPVAA